MTPALVLAATLAAQAAPPLTPREEQAFEGRSRQEARLRNLYGGVRVRLSNAVTLEAASGPYLLLRYQVRSARSVPVAFRPGNLQVRIQGGRWLAAEGIAERPPLASYPHRPSLTSRQPVEVPRDQIWPLYASFRTEEPADRVDPAVVQGGVPVFLLHPLRASLEALAEEALRRSSEENLALAEGLLAEAARGGPATRHRLGSFLIERARALRRADRPVLEDRVLRLALPYAPNPTFVQARLAELRRKARRRHRDESWRPPERDWAYHRRRAEMFRVDPPSRRVPPSGEP